MKVSASRPKRPAPMLVVRLFQRLAAMADHRCRASFQRNSAESFPAHHPVGNHRRHKGFHRSRKGDHASRGQQFSHARRCKTWQRRHRRQRQTARQVAEPGLDRIHEQDSQGQDSRGHANRNDQPGSFGGARRSNTIRAIEARPIAKARALKLSRARQRVCSF